MNLLLLRREWLLPLLVTRLRLLAGLRLLLGVILLRISHRVLLYRKFRYPHSMYGNSTPASTLTYTW